MCRGTGPAASARPSTNREQHGMSHLLSLYLRGFALLISLLALPAAAAYPDHQVTIVVPFAPGGGSDIAARVLSKYLTQDFKQSFIVDNRPGAGGNIAAHYTAQARPE